MQPGIAAHAELGAEIEAGMRVDQQHRMAVASQLRSDRDAVRSARLALGRREFGYFDRFVITAVEIGELGEIDMLDIATDAALGEAQGHPWLEPGEHLRLCLGMGGEIIVQPVGPGVHQRAQPWRALAVLRLKLDGIDPQPLAQILPDRALALRLGGAAERGQVIGLDPREIIFCLGVDRAEHGIGIAPAMDMRDAPIVAHDLDPCGLGLPAGLFGRRRGERGGGGEQKRDGGRRQGRYGHRDAFSLRSS